MGRTGNSALAADEQGCAEQLARFFPQVGPVRIAVQVISPLGGKTQLREATMVEFSSPDHAIFLSTLPLEFGDRVRLEANPNEASAEATVDAVQYHEGRKAVAVRFLQGPCEWVVRQP